MNSITIDNAVVWGIMRTYTTQHFRNSLWSKLSVKTMRWEIRFQLILEAEDE